MVSPEILRNLRDSGMLRSASPGISPLAGGVSCDIHLIEDGERRFVIKWALGKLRVKDDWFADTARNHFEQAYMRYADSVVPGCVPRILHADATLGYFAMEYLGDGWRNWKSELLAGRADPAHAARAGGILGSIHAASWENDTLREEFATTENFRQLRIDPYLLTAGMRNPALEAYFRDEADRLAKTPLALVHGDFSPKNMLLHTEERLVILDCEVAWFGDPAFDVAFLANHFFLKALHLPAHAPEFLELVAAFLAAYRNALGPTRATSVEVRAARLLPMLLLARVDGKSPVEYLDGRPAEQKAIREFAGRVIPSSPTSFADLIGGWKLTIQFL